MVVPKKLSLLKKWLNGQRKKLKKKLKDVEDDTKTLLNSKADEKWKQRICEIKMQSRRYWKASFQN